MNRVLVLHALSEAVVFALGDRRGLGEPLRLDPDDMIVKIDCSDRCPGEVSGQGKRQHRGSGVKREFDPDQSRQQRRAFEREQRKGKK